MDEGLAPERMDDGVAEDDLMDDMPPLQSQVNAGMQGSPPLPIPNQEGQPSNTTSAPSQQPQPAASTIASSSAGTSAIASASSSGNTNIAGRGSSLANSATVTSSTDMSRQASIPAAVTPINSHASIPRWQVLHKEAGPCRKCAMCQKSVPYGPRLYTHPQQWSSPQLQAMAVSANIGPSECVCRVCLLSLMKTLALSNRNSQEPSGPVAETIEAALSGRPRSSAAPTSASASRTSDKSGSRHPAPAGGNGTGRQQRGTPMVSDDDSGDGSDSSHYADQDDDSDNDRTYRVSSKKRKHAPTAVKQVACAYPKCPEPARHHIGKRSHPAAATLLSLSWDVIKASCDSSGRLPLCNEHHQTINQLNGPSGKGYQRTAVRDLVGQSFRPEDYGPAFASSSSVGGSSASSSSASKSCATGSSGRKGRKWRAIDTNTPFARALRALPKAVERPDRTYCGLVRMPVTCLLPASHDMTLDRTVPHVPPSSLSAAQSSTAAAVTTAVTVQTSAKKPAAGGGPAISNGNLAGATAATSSGASSTGNCGSVGGVSVATGVCDAPPVQRYHTHRLFGCVPVDMSTGESVPEVHLLYSKRPQISTSKPVVSGTKSPLLPTGSSASSNASNVGTAMTSAVGHKGSQVPASAQQQRAVHHPPQARGVPHSGTVGGKQTAPVPANVAANMHRIMPGHHQQQQAQQRAAQKHAGGHAQQNLGSRMMHANAPTAGIRPVTAAKSHASGSPVFRLPAPRPQHMQPPTIQHQQQQMHLQSLGRPIAPRPASHVPAASSSASQHIQQQQQAQATRQHPGSPKMKQRQQPSAQHAARHGVSPTAGAQPQKQKAQPHAPMAATARSTSTAASATAATTTTAPSSSASAATATTGSNSTAGAGATSSGDPSSQSYFQLNGIRQHLDIPAQLTDLDIQRQEEKVRELHRKLQQAAAR